MADLDAIVEAYNDCLLIVLAEASAWNELAEQETDSARAAELRHVASALRRAAAHIRVRAEARTSSGEHEGRQL